MTPVTIATISFIAENEDPEYLMIERQIFSVITQVKNGIKAVKSLIVFLAVHFAEKQERPAIIKKIGIKMLENP